MIFDDKFVRTSMFPTLFGRKIGRRLLANREQLGPDAFYEKYYADTDVERDIVTAVYVLGENNIDILLKGMLPENRWVEDIYGDDRVDYVGLVEFLSEIEDVFGIQIKEDEFDGLSTVDDLIRYLNRKVQKGEASCPENPGQRPEWTSGHRAYQYILNVLGGTLLVILGLLTILLLLGVLLVLWRNWQAVP